MSRSMSLTLKPCRQATDQTNKELYCEKRGNLFFLIHMNESIHKQSISLALCVLGNHDANQVLCCKNHVNINRSPIEDPSVSYVSRSFCLPFFYFSGRFCPSYLSCSSWSPPSSGLAHTQARCKSTDIVWFYRNVFCCCCQYYLPAAEPSLEAFHFLSVYLRHFTLCCIILPLDFFLSDFLYIHRHIFRPLIYLSNYPFT